MYLTNIEDLPEFTDVRNSHFGQILCALTVVGMKGLALVESIIEINIFSVKDSGRIKKQIVEHAPSSAMRPGPATVRAHHFVADLNAVYPALRSWQEKLPGSPLPFGAVRTPAPLPVPACDVIMDAWVYCP